MFNLLPGNGLGFSGSRELAFGLGSMMIDEYVVEYGGRNKNMILLDNEYSGKKNDQELIEFLSIIFQVIK